MLEVSDLSGGYGQIPIITAISMQVSRGEFVGIFGHNGMGKTTLLRLLAGHLKTAAGSIVLDGNNITRFGPHRRARLGLGYVPQGRQIFSQLTVLENLRVGAFAAGRNDSDVRGVLDRFPRLATLRGRNAGVLSGGEQQLLAIARCLCGAPRLLLLDEPTEGVQPSIIDELLDLLQSLHKEAAITVVLVEQSIDFIRQLSDRVLILQKGRIIREVSAKELEGLLDEFVGLDLAHDPHVGSF